MISYYPMDNNQNNFDNFNSSIIIEPKCTTNDNYEQYKDEVIDSLLFKIKEIEIYKEDKKKYIFYPFI